MRFIIGQKNTPHGATRGAVAGCGCSGGGASTTNPPRFGWKAGMTSGAGNPMPQMRYGQRYGGVAIAGGFATRCTKGQVLVDGRCVYAFHPPFFGRPRLAPLPGPITQPWAQIP